MEKTASSAAQLLSIVEITPNHLCKGKRLSNLHFVQNFGCQNDLSLSKLIANKHVARVRIFTDFAGSFYTNHLRTHFHSKVKACKCYLANGVCY